MKNALLALAAIFGVVHHACAIKCPNTPTYDKKIKDINAQCDAKGIKILWPNYENVEQYYRCQGEGNAVLDYCPSYSIFDYAQQKCSRCAGYVPSPTCDEIAKNNCESFKSVVEKPESCNINFKFSQSFIPACVGNDIYMYWPKYNNLSQYFWCQGAHNPQIKTCKDGKFFNFYKQSCVECSSFIAPPPCDKLHFDKSNKCVPINSLTDPIPLTTEDKTCFDLMKGFTKTLEPSCEKHNILWPNYENFAQYYICLGPNNPQITSCPPNSYFSYPLQNCVRCKNFIPPPKCEDLPSGKGTCIPFTPPQEPQNPVNCDPDYTVYKTKLQLSCIGNDVYRVWPDYENAKQFIRCQGPYNPQTETCPDKTFFNFYQQECTPCQQFSQPPDCTKLQPPDSSRQCVKK